MFHTNDPREEEFITAIKSAERQRALFPFVLLGFLVLFLWLAGGDLFERPSLETSYPFVILLGTIYIGSEVLNVKILMYKAEYRDWLREFRSEAWKSTNED